MYSFLCFKTILSSVVSLTPGAGQPGTIAGCRRRRKESQNGRWLRRHQSSLGKVRHQRLFRSGAAGRRLSARDRSGAVGDCLLHPGDRGRGAGASPELTVEHFRGHDSLSPLETMSQGGHRNAHPESLVYVIGGDRHPAAEAFNVGIGVLGDDPAPSLEGDGEEAPEFILERRHRLLVFILFIPAVLVNALRS